MKGSTNNNGEDSNEKQQPVTSYNDLNLDPFVKENYLNDLKDDPRNENKQAGQNPMKQLEGLFIYHR